MRADERCEACGAACEVRAQALTLPMIYDDGGGRVRLVCEACLPPDNATAALVLDTPLDALRAFACAFWDSDERGPVDGASDADVRAFVCETIAHGLEDGNITEDEVCPDLFVWLSPEERYGVDKGERCYRTDDQDPGDDTLFTLREMLESNEESPETCAAIRALAPGEKSVGIVTVERVK